MKQNIVIEELQNKPIIMHSYPATSPPSSSLTKTLFYTLAKNVRVYSSPHKEKLTLKLLWTRVSSKSMTMHFLCMSECRTGGSKYFWLDGGGVIVPSIGVPFCVVFVRAFRQQQKIDCRKPLFGGFARSALWCRCWAAAAKRRREGKRSHRLVSETL